MSARKMSLNRGRVHVLSNGKTIEEPRSWTWLIVLCFIVAFWFSARITGFSLPVLMKRGKNFIDILVAMVPPNWDYFRSVEKPLIDTIKMSLLGSAVGSLLCVPVAMLAAQNLVHHKVIYSLAKFFLSLVRTLPTLIAALIATYIFGLGTFAGTVAIAIFTFAYVGKQLYEQLETCELGAYEALLALGASKPRAIWAAMMPQVLPAYLSTCLFCFEGNVRYASILGYVGAGGLGLLLNEKISWREYDSVGTILITLFVTVVLIEALSHWLRSKLT